MSDLKNLFIAYIIYLIGVIFMIVFFDLDGTLISDDEAYIIPDSAVNAIHKAQENGLSHPAKEIGRASCRERV